MLLNHTPFPDNGESVSPRVWSWNLKTRHAMARGSTVQGSYTVQSRQQSVSRSGWQNVHCCTAASEVLRALLLRIRVFWDVTPCGWVSGSTTPSPLKIKTPRPFETSGTTSQNSVTPLRTSVNVCVSAVPEYCTNPSQKPPSFIWKWGP